MKNRYIPLDKSWIIRMGFLDIIHGSNEILKFLNNQKILSDDLKALKRVAQLWRSNKPIDIGESGTIYRFFQFASWKLNLRKQFIIRRTLRKRNITHNSHIVTYSLKKLLKLDHGTSQWASVAVLLGNTEKTPNPPYKLKLTRTALKHWRERKRQHKNWLPRYDTTIERQAKTFLQMCRGKKPVFLPRQAEDFCFAYVFGYITEAKGVKKWPSLRSHESNRPAETKTMFNRAKGGLRIDSKDHRIIQALVMWGIVNKKKLIIRYPNVVNKSWPEFWNFIEKTSKI